MRQTSRNSWLTAFLEIGILIIIVLVPFDATLTVWLSSWLGHYTLIRLWKETLLAALFVAAAIAVYRDKETRTNLTSNRLNWLIIGYIFLHVLLGGIALARHQVDLKALGYALIVNLRLVIFFWVCGVAATRGNLLKKNWAKILLIPAVIVVVFGLMQQFVLPTSFLSHLGYGPHTIAPYETVDQNKQYVRVQATLRGPNPLGAYLVIIITALVICFLGLRNYLKRGEIAVLGILALQVLLYTYSRSAWLAVLVAVGLGLWFMLLKKTGRQIAVAVLVVIVVVGGIIGFDLRHNLRFENTFLHTSSQTRSPRSSNQNHESAVESGLKDVVHQPLGRGPGTAGPASVYNNHPARIAENYYVQLGQEVGVIGLALFVAINILVTLELWKRRDDPLASVLLYSLIGISLINLLSLAWTDDTLAYIWWGLAGITLGPGILKAKEFKVHEKEKLQNKKAPRKGSFS